ncbi:MAG: HPr family phosphocarrier protein [Eubacterium sp.]
MIADNVTVQNRAGLHAKPASMFVQKANQFKSEVYIQKGSTRVNAKSIMGVMILAVQQGDSIVIEASGDDEELAVSKLKELIENKFDLPDEV